MQTNGSYFVCARTIRSSHDISPRAIAELEERIRRIDDEVSVVYVNGPGVGHKVWLERPSDGMHNSMQRRLVDRQCIEVLNEWLDGDLD